MIPTDSQLCRYLNSVHVLCGNVDQFCRVSHMETNCIVIRLEMNIVFDPVERNRFTKILCRQGMES